MTLRRYRKENEPRKHRQKHRDNTPTRANGIRGQAKANIHNHINAIADDHGSDDDEASSTQDTTTTQNTTTMVAIGCAILVQLDPVDRIVPQQHQSFVSTPPFSIRNNDDINTNNKDKNDSSSFDSDCRVPIRFWFPGRTGFYPMLP